MEVGEKRIASLSFYGNYGRDERNESYGKLQTERIVKIKFPLDGVSKLEIRSRDLIHCVRGAVPEYQYSSFGAVS